jgi:hypothetical protein
MLMSKLLIITHGLLHTPSKHKKEDDKSSSVDFVIFDIEDEKSSSIELKIFDIEDSNASYPNDCCHHIENMITSI